MKRKPQPVVRKKRAPLVERDPSQTPTTFKHLYQLECRVSEELRAELAAARDEATKLRAERDVAVMQFDLLEAEFFLATDSHDSYIASYALHSKQVLAFLDNLPMDVKGQRWMSPSKWRECVKFFEPNI